MEGHRRPGEDPPERPTVLTSPTRLGPGRALARLVRSWPARIAVQGHSMAPTVNDGDWLLVDPEGYRDEGPRPGDLVLAQAGERLIVKRVAGVAVGGTLLLMGDAPSDDGHRHDATVPKGAVAGRPWFRYWPLAAFGRVR